MINGRKVIAIVPARAGSKGLPGKNLKAIAGKPLLAWSIEQGLGSRFIDKVVVSTDCENIARVGEQYGAEAPFLRPEELASDTATSISVIQHCLQWYKAHDEEFDYIVLLEPTSPLRDIRDIDNGLMKLISSNKARSLVSIAKVDTAHPVFLSSMAKGGLLTPYLEDSFVVKRRQELEEVFHFAGLLYVSEINCLLEKQSFYHEETIGFEVPKAKSFDIDDMDDFVAIEALMKFHLSSENND